MRCARHRFSVAPVNTTVIITTVNRMAEGVEKRTSREHYPCNLRRRSFTIPLTWLGIIRVRVGLETKAAFVFWYDLCDLFDLMVDRETNEPLSYAPGPVCLL